MNPTANCDCEPMNPDLVAQIRAEMPEPEKMKRLTRFFKVVGDETRMTIMTALGRQELCVSDIANILDMTKSAVSHQLKVLTDAGQVKSRRDGKNVYYSLDDEHVVEIMRGAQHHIDHRNCQ